MGADGDSSDQHRPFTHWNIRRRVRRHQVACGGHGLRPFTAQDDPGGLPRPVCELLGGDAPLEVWQLGACVGPLATEGGLRGRQPGEDCSRAGHRAAPHGPLGHLGGLEHPLLEDAELPTA
eukprot:5257477-Pyramimonas_sp.AAC.1